ncbi:MAG: ferrochelatase [Acidobacteria bacterium]|nr:ferrochelatase [Acidobacteriota bacterium]
MPDRTSEPLVGVLLLAHGGPDSLDDVEPFLSNIRGGKPVPQSLVEIVRERYRLIGSRSPLLEISQRQAQALERELNAAGKHFRVYLGMRNWRPFIRETMQEIAQEPVSRLLVLCLAPQNSRLSVGLYRQHVERAQQELALAIPMRFIESWHQEPLLIEAFAEKLTPAIAAPPPAPDPAVEVIFTAHSLPERIVADGDPYDGQVRETVSAVALRCGLERWHFAYQSQGATAEPWLGPTVESVLEKLAAAGARQVLLVPIGFVADHVEVLYDIDIAFRQFAEARGLQLRRTESLNDSPTLIRALASVVQQPTVLLSDPSLPKNPSLLREPK